MLWLRRGGRFHCRLVGLAVFGVVILVLKTYPDSMFCPSTDLVAKRETELDGYINNVSPRNTAHTASDVRSQTSAFKRSEENPSKAIQMKHGNNKTYFAWTCEQHEENVRSRCAQRKFSPLSSYRKTSVIMSFHDSESLSYLLHTIHSVVQRTPPEILEEIIVIDDFSQKEEFGETLEIYLSTVFRGKVSLHRNNANLGLIKSRVKGARLAKGPILVFMDSHAEVLDGWLEPLLNELKKDHKTLACSIIDWLENKDGKWTYKYGCTEWTVVFDWSMGFGWNTLPQDDRLEDITEAFNSTAIIGAFYAIEKEFFTSIGEFDEKMEFWGGENFDISLRVWLYEGRVVLVPCSRVAHIEGKGSRSYRMSYQETIERNYKRLAEIWFDDYKDCFYFYFPHLATVDAGNLTERLQIKAKAPRTFSWYLENIIPTMGCPTKDGLGIGPIQNVKTKFCLTSSSDWTLSTADCQNRQMKSFKLYWSNKFHLREPNYVFRFENNQILNGEYLYNYKECGVYCARWLHWKDGPIIDAQSKLCLEDEGDDSGKVKLVECNYQKNPAQLWEFDRYTDQYESLINNRSKSLDEDTHNALLAAFHSRKFE